MRGWGSNKMDSVKNGNLERESTAGSDPQLTEKRKRADTQESKPDLEKNP